MSKPTHKNSRGFTLVELMIGMAVFIIISGAVLQGIGTLQKSYRTSEMHSTMQQRLRATLELMAQEIGQAGLQASTVEGNNVATTGGAPYIITQLVPANNTSAVSVNSLTGLFVGQWLVVDGGANQDTVQIMAMSLPTASPLTITPSIMNSTGHAVNTPFYPLGIFPHGIMAGGTNDPSTSTKLVMYGDLHGSGNGLYAVEYNCVPPNLTRTEWNLDLASPTASTNTLLDTVATGGCTFCWPGATGCDAGAATPQTVSLPVPPSYTCSTGLVGGPCPYTMITQVGFTVTTTDTDVTSGTSQTITMTKSFSNIQPRNIIAANNIYSAAITNAANAAAEGVTGATFSRYLYGELQPDPPILSSITW